MVKRWRGIGRLALLLGVTLVVASGCAFDGAIRSDFYQPAPGAKKLPLRVALMDDASLRPAPVVQYGMNTFYVTIVPGFTNAIHAELTSLFEEVKPVREIGQARADDVIVSVNSAYMADVNDRYGHLLYLSVRPPGWKENLARYEASTAYLSPCRAACDVAPMLTGLSLLTLTPIVMPWGAALVTNHAEENLEQATAAMLRDLSAQVRNDVRVQNFIEQKQALPAAIAAGEQAERSGQSLKALEQYARAWQARPNSDLERRLEEKIGKLAAGQSALPPVPEEARRYYARASAHMQAATTEGYANVLNEMQRAVGAAPLWAEAYYNLGLIQESAGHYTDAIRSLKLYLLLAPRSSDAPAVQTKVYELEVAVEKAMK